jgi:crotonobetainyl-CoA:carnitine CoA-transferase CaiB-like acyl-CoA transferase
LQGRQSGRSTLAWTQFLEDKAVPCGPINDMAQAFADPQVQARGLVLKQPVAQITPGQVDINSIATQATITTVASPLRQMATPPVMRRAPPSLGEHTDEVLAELGLDAPQIAALRGRGVV